MGNHIIVLILNLHNQSVNPHQSNASISFESKLPFKVLNGSPGYINMLDAFNAWPLVNVYEI